MAILTALEEEGSSSGGSALEEESSSSGGSGYSSYDVFLSFRGKDTRFSFTDHLYSALVQAGIDTFRDNDEIGDGETLKPAIKKAIKESRASIIVLSENYASSTWCLDELRLILKRRRTSNHFVLPVFYHVVPSDVRKQKGSFAEAFHSHEQKQVGTEKQHKWQQKLKKWRDALTEVADMKGKEVAERYESQFINEIVGKIYSKVDGKVLSNPKYLVGMQSRVKDLNSWVASDVVVLAIWGMGGIGKTTLSEHIYYSNFRDFECRTFLADIRKMSEQLNGLLGLQKRLLLSILNKQMSEIVNDTHEATAMIEKALRRKKVLLVLDDVDEKEQIDALLGKSQRFYPGSKIIITTRNKLLLEFINRPYQEHTLEKLNDDESLELLSWHAFQLYHPKEGYEKLSKDVASYCGGIPLALEVLGSSLRGKGIDTWESRSNLLKKENNPKIQKILRISFDSLEYNDDKEVFLHIACFFVGMDKDYVVKILGSSIESLVDRCLLDIGRHNKLKMHRLLQEMGREIVYQQSPDNPGERSRLWCDDDSFNVLKEGKATEKIKGLMLDMENLPNQVNSHEKSSFNCLNFLNCFNFWTSKEEELKTDAFTRMDNLALLKLNYARLDGTYKDFPRKLRWLCWHGFPLKSIPLELPMENLVALDMSYSKLKHVWSTATKVLKSLKILDLSYSVELVRTPDFSGLLNLETLRLTGCTSLVEISESIEKLEKLFVLDLTGCVNLKKFPTSIGMLKSLKELYVDRMGINLVCHHHTMKSPKAGLFRSPKLSLPSLPRSLVKLSIAHNNLFYFPSEIECLTSLKYLDLEGNPLTILPKSVENLVSLEWLNVNDCGRLNSLVLSAIERVVLKGCHLLENVTASPPGSNQPDIMWRRQKLHTLREIQGVSKLQPAEIVDKNILNTLGLFNFEQSQYTDVVLNNLGGYHKLPVQVLSEFGICSTFIAGREVPTWFRGKRCKETSISISINSNNRRIRGLKIASVYRLSGKIDCCHPHLLFIKVTNTTWNLIWMYTPSVYGVPEGGEGIVWLSDWTLGNHLHDGDQVTVSIVVGNGLEFTEFGISITYYDMQEEKDDEVGQNGQIEEHRWKELIGGDLSPTYELSSQISLPAHGIEFLMGLSVRVPVGEGIKPQVLNYLRNSE